MFWRVYIHNIQAITYIYHFLLFIFLSCIHTHTFVMYCTIHMRIHPNRQIDKEDSNFLLQSKVLRYIICATYTRQLRSMHESVYKMEEKRKRFIVQKQQKLLCNFSCCCDAMLMWAKDCHKIFIHHRHILNLLSIIYSSFK